MAKKPNPKYVAECKAFLAQKAEEPNVSTLAKGVLIEYERRGEGTVSPTRRNVVTVNYEGRLIDGRVFDSNKGAGCPMPLRVSEVIVGWQILLTTLHVGDKVVAYIPSEVGYGDRREGDIPGGSTLVFEIELVGIH